jgi:digeranylgeranylglycerophospholipid reductase
MIDVVVIGAGPAGSTVGQKIAVEGYNVLILEKSQSPGKNKICGGAISEKCFNDLKLPAKIIEKKTSRVVVHFPGEKLESPGKHSFALFNRENFDVLLAHKAVDGGAKLFTSTLAFDVRRDSDGVTIYYKKFTNGEMKRVRARLAIFADGTGTLASKKLGLGFKGKPAGTALAAAYDLKWLENSKCTIDFFFGEEISPFGYGWIFPKRDSINIGVLCLQSEIKKSIGDYLKRFVSSEKLSSQEVIRSGSRLMPQSITSKIFGERVLVVGDAAGTADPIDGGGICNAIVSGKVAAKVSIEALEDKNTTSDFLASYDSLWKRTENYKKFQRSYGYQQLALKTGANLGAFLKHIGLFNRYIVID